MADHVPADVGRELLHFIAQFLHFIFSEIADALPVDFLQHFQRFCFADSDQRHFLAGTSCTLTSLLYMILPLFLNFSFNHIYFLRLIDQIIFVNLTSVECYMVIERNSVCCPVRTMALFSFLDREGRSV